MRARKNIDLTAVACPGWLEDIPGACGKLHPLHEPPDPPLPTGLLAVIDRLLEEWLGRSSTARSARALPGPSKTGR
jgi:hypothetical protein